MNDEPDKPSPPKKLVGLDLGSTTQGGTGPRFGIGDTQSGKTDKIAEDPNRTPEVEKPEPPKAPNRKATRIPVEGVKLVKPKRRVRVKPKYPGTLRAQGIEGNVIVQVDLDAAGNVLGVKVIKPSAHAEMNREALVTAKKEKFSPASRGGKAIPFTLSYTIRFRLEEG